MKKRKEKPNVFSMLIVQCDQACDSISFLVDFMNEGGQKLADVIELTEKDADQTRRDLISYVQNTFITPLDRHDLFALSRSFDDLTDAVKDLKDFILFFDFAPTAKNIEMAALAEESINLLTASMKDFSAENTDNFWAGLVKVKKNDSQVKRLYWANIKEIEEENSMQSIITSREFCRDLRNLSKKVDKAADRLGDLKIKSIK